MPRLGSFNPRKMFMAATTTGQVKKHHNSEVTNLHKGKYSKTVSINANDVSHNAVLVHRNLRQGTPRTTAINTNSTITAPLHGINETLKRNPVTQYGLRTTMQKFNDILAAKSAKPYDQGKTDETRYANERRIAKQQPKGNEAHGTSRRTRSIGSSFTSVRGKVKNAVGEPGRRVESGFDAAANGLNLPVFAVVAALIFFAQTSQGQSVMRSISDTAGSVASGIGSTIGDFASQGLEAAKEVAPFAAVALI